MPSPEQIDSIHRLHHVENWSLRKIARHLKLHRRTVAKFLSTPAPPPVTRPRWSKLDAFKPAIAELLQQDPKARAPVIAQRLQPLGYEGGLTILRIICGPCGPALPSEPTCVWNPRRGNASRS